MAHIRNERFCELHIPSSEEIVTRNNVISTLKKEIGKFWPGTETHVLGRATDLYLPGSDIDMVVVSETGDYENRSRLYQLSTFLRTKSWLKCRGYCQC